MIINYKNQKNKKKIMPIKIGGVVNHYVGPFTFGIESMVHSIAEAINSNNNRSLAAMR